MKFGLKLKLKRLIQWTLAVLITIHIITGYGITQYRTVEMLTFGLLTKALSFRLHSFLAIPVIVLLVLHIYFALNVRFRRNNDKKRT